ncbi:MAG TPA: S41 family peptidase [Bryobacterales bacterium]|nr:S41 family peptidase [Bryobacterales bacterium]
MALSLRRLFAFLTALLPAGGLWLFAPMAAAQDRAAAVFHSEPQSRNLRSFDYIWTTIRDKHWDPKLGGLDWQSVRDELRPRVEKTATPAEARPILQEMIGRLHQSHFGVVPSDIYQDIQEPSGQIAPEDEGWTGLDVRVIGGKALVTSVDAGAPAYIRGVRPGWQLLKIDHAPVESLLEKVNTAYWNSTMRGLLLARAVLSKLNGRVGTQARIEFLDGAGKIVETDIARTRPSGIQSRFGYLPACYVRMESRRLGGNIGYIGFNFFLAPAAVMKKFEEAVKSCRECPGIIIDLRGNPGGIGAMAIGMAGWFINQPNQQLGAMYTRDATLHFIVNPRLETYGGPLAILVDDCSASTSEVFAQGMRDLGRARIFGIKTAGAALPSVFERLPNGDGFQYAIANYLSKGGKTLEGAGVVPDEEVKLSRAALLEGRDPVLEAALRWIQAQSTQNGSGR